MKSDIVASFKGKRVLLVGDAILDIYIYCNRIGDALYAPVPEVEELKESVSFGGNGLVATNILELGGNLTFFSVVGDDPDARRYDSFTHKNLKKVFFTDPTRKTTVKRRWYADGKALLQANVVDNHDINSALEKKVIKSLGSHIKKSDVVVVMDPQHGFLTKGLVGYLKKESKKHEKPIYVDVQVAHRKSNHHLYKGVDTIVLNENEAKSVYPRFDSRKPEPALHAIKKKFALNNVVIKLGDRGSASLMGGMYIRSEPHKVKAQDVCGAGDAFLAALSLGDRGRPKESLEAANVWGALSTTIHGTIPPNRKDLIKIIHE